MSELETNVNEEAEQAEQAEQVEQVEQEQVEPLLTLKNNEGEISSNSFIAAINCDNGEILVHVCNMNLIILTQIIQSLQKRIMKMAAKDILKRYESEEVPHE